jgi:hypothetical protein
MEEYERREKDKRLVELINHIDECGNKGDIVNWLDSVPEITEICIFLGEETKDKKYTDILKAMLEGLDDILVDATKNCNIDQKEVYGVLRLRISKMMTKVQD